MGGQTHSYSHLAFDKPKTYVGEKTVSLTNDVEKNVYPHVED
jgi:hypothetical protein